MYNSILYKIRKLFFNSDTRFICCVTVRRLSGPTSHGRRLAVRMAVRVSRAVWLVRRAGDRLVDLGSMDHWSRLVSSLRKDGEK